MNAVLYSHFVYFCSHCGADANINWLIFVLHCSSLFFHIVFHIVFGAMYIMIEEYFVHKVVIATKNHIYIVTVL